MPEYIIPSTEKSTLIFASDTCEDGQDTFPWHNIPAVWNVENTQRTILDAVLDYTRIRDFRSSDFSTKITAAAAAGLDLLGQTFNDERTATFTEACEICEDTIPFESLTDASCHQGHQCSKLLPFV